jgi:hypothetical protein
MSSVMMAAAKDILGKRASSALRLAAAVATNSRPNRQRHAIQSYGFSSMTAGITIRMNISSSHSRNIPGPFSGSLCCTC